MKKVVVLIVSVLLGLVSLSGCLGPWAVDTLGWDHINEEGTSIRIWGQLTITENIKNWNVGFVWDTEHHNDWKDYSNTVWADNYEAFNTFSVDLDSLNRYTEYHYRAFGEHLESKNQFRIGIDKTFIPGSPTISSVNTSNIELNSVTLNGFLWHLGGAPTCEVFFEYGTDSEYLNFESSHLTLDSVGEFSVQIFNLVTCTKYYFRAIAQNDAGADVGWTLEVVPGEPIVVTRLPSQVGVNNAELSGELWNTGGPASSEVWFEYGDDNPNNLDKESDHITLDSLEPFNIEILNLITDTTYWVRAVANNGFCTGKGDIRQFKTTSTYQNITCENVISFEKSKFSDGKLIEKYPFLDKFIQILIERYPLLQELIIR
jgi:hypothetical protein